MSPDDLLGTHVAHGPDHLARHRLHRGLQVGLRRAREAEVEHLRLARLGDEDVGRLQVAVDDAALVRVLHGVGDSATSRALPRSSSLLRDVVVERAAAHQLHREVGLRTEARVGDARLVDLRDAGMLQAAEELDSCSKRRSIAGVATPGRNTLSATRRRGRSCSAS